MTAAEFQKIKDLIVAGTHRIKGASVADQLWMLEGLQEIFDIFSIRRLEASDQKREELQAERGRVGKLVSAIEAFCDGEHSHCGNLFALKQVLAEYQEATRADD